MSQTDDSLTAERDQLRAEVERLAAERDALIRVQLLPVPLLGGPTIYRLLGDPSGLAYPSHTRAVQAIRERAGLDPAPTAGGEGS